MSGGIKTGQGWKVLLSWVPQGSHSQVSGDGRQTVGEAGWRPSGGSTKPDRGTVGSRLNPPGCLDAWIGGINVTELGVSHHVTALRVQEVVLLRGGIWLNLSL